MKKLIVAILVSVASVGHTAAQHIQIVSATRQDWSGGVAGHRGTNYCFVIKVEVRITPDSIYTNGQGFQLPHDGYDESTIKYDTVDHTYTIYASESHVDPEYPDPANMNVASKRPVPVVRQFNGAALLVYRHQKKKQIFVVKTIDTLPAIAYP